MQGIFAIEYAMQIKALPKNRNQLQTGAPNAKY